MLLPIELSYGPKEAHDVCKPPRPRLWPQHLGVFPCARTPPAYFDQATQYHTECKRVGNPVNKKQDMSAA